MSFKQLLFSKKNKKRAIRPSRSSCYVMFFMLRFFGCSVFCLRSSQITPDTGIRDVFSHIIQ